MIYEERKAKGNVVNFVQCFWTSEALVERTNYTILPDGYFDLIVEIRNNQISRVKLTGIWTIPVNIKSDLNTRIFAVRFKPLAIELFTNLNVKSLLNSSVNLTEDFFCIRQLKDLHFNDFCVHIENYLQTCILKNKTINDLKIGLFSEIFKKDIFNVKELSERTNWKSRQLNRYFNMTFGFSIKEYLNIIRSNESYKDIANNTSASKIHYYDQAHFIKEMKRYSGVTPKELRRNENDRFLQLLTIKGI